MISYNEAKAMVFESVRRMPVKKIPLDEIVDGLVLAEDIASPIDLPPFDNSAMDGFAVACCHSHKSGNLECTNEIPAFAGMTISQIIKAGDTPNHLDRKSVV